MGDDQKIDVAFCCDAQMECGLHAALAAVLSSNPGRLRLWIVLKDFSAEASARIRATVAKVDPHADLRFTDVDLTPYMGFRGLHGNHTAYARLALPNSLPVEKFIYLDSDTLCTADLSELYNTPLGDAFMGMVAHDKKRHHPEMKIYREVGIAENSPYFNSGILLVDAAEWRRRDITGQCLAFGRRFAAYLMTADQACLNGVGGNDILRLDKKWNLPLYAGTQSMDKDAPPAIYHFISVPKPWDVLAFFVHPNFPLFDKYLKLSCGWSVWLRNQLKLTSYLRLKKFWSFYRNAITQKKTPAF
jgi:lipopolysaccharide biosynthesis glycosyltransferase